MLVYLTLYYKHIAITTKIGVKLVNNTIHLIKNPYIDTDKVKLLPKEVTIAIKTISGLRNQYRSKYFFKNSRPGRILLWYQLRVIQL